MSGDARGPRCGSCDRRLAWRCRVRGRIRSGGSHVADPDLDNRSGSHITAGPGHFLGTEPTGVRSRSPGNGVQWRRSHGIGPTHPLDQLGSTEGRGTWRRLGTWQDRLRKRPSHACHPDRHSPPQLQRHADVRPARLARAALLGLPAVRAERRVQPQVSSHVCAAPRLRTRGAALELVREMAAWTPKPQAVGTSRGVHGPRGDRLPP